MAATTGERITTEEAVVADVRSFAPGGRGRSLGGYLFMPALVTATLVILYFVVRGRELSSGEQRVLTFDNVMDTLGVHLRVTAVSTILVLLIAIP